MIYKGFRIKEVTPSKRTSFRIYQDGKYLQTCNTLKKAKQSINFNLKHGVWKGLD